MLSGRHAATAAAVLTLTLLAGGCGDEEEPEGESPPETPSASTAASDPTEPTQPTEPTDEPSVEPATGPELDVKGVTLRLPEGWHVDNTDASFLHVGAADDRTGLINLSSFPALDQDTTLDRLARSTLKTGNFDNGEVLPEATIDGEPAFHVSGDVYGDYTEEFGLLHGDEIVTVEFVHRRGPRTDWPAMIESVLATVDLP